MKIKTQNNITNVNYKVKIILIIIKMSILPHSVHKSKHLVK
jgi:hypothetical protein